MPAPRLTKAVASFSTAAVLLSSLFALPAAAAQEPAIDPGPVAPPSTSQELPAQAASRFVVKFKSGTAGTASARAKAYGQAARTAGVSVKELRTTGTGASVVQTSEILTPGERASVVASLRSQTNVGSVVPDTFVRPAATVSDPYFQYQWDYTESTGGMRVPAAWDVTTGRGATVAVIDTGITTHSDLAANIVPGYDFISDPGISNDGDGRDANATDTGDYCNGAASSWHGTHVAGTIAAVGNNGRGIAGVAYGAKVQPLRALGACGGYMSDIADAVVWAAGGTVAGLPANPTPAQVINMSLGGSGQCEPYFQSALDFAASKGAVVVAAAGNENSPASGSTPANCDKVITVGATGRDGSRAFYSNYGPEVDVSAPGGDATASAFNAILSTWNDGETAFGSEAYGFMQGTSMAAPHVAALAALMMTSGSTLAPADVEAKMKATARPLPGTCDTGGCGSGLVDAWVAVRASMSSAPTLTPGEPTVLGTPAYGQTLTVGEGTWTPTATSYDYQWLRNGDAIAFATQRTYQPDLGDLGASISVRVTGHRTEWASAVAVSDPVVVPEPMPIGTIAPAPSDTPAPDPAPTETVAPAPAYAPTITGEAKVGSTLTAEEGKYGFWTYQWSNSDGPIDWATNKTYTPKPSDLGKTISVTVTVHSLTPEEDTVTGASAETAPVGEGALTAAKPTVTGSPAVGATLTAVPGAWTDDATLRYQWHRAGMSIPTATASTYTPTVGDLDQPLSVSITGTAPGYTPLTLESDATERVVVGTLTGATPTIAGTVTVDQKLTAVAGTWTAGTTLNYQWYRAGSAVPGATGQAYMLTPADVGQTISIRVTRAKDGYAGLAKESEPTATVAAATFSQVKTPVISGAAMYLETLSVPRYTYEWFSTPAALSRSVQWYRDGVAIAGAAGYSYSPSIADIGHVMSVRLTITKPGYVAYVSESAPTVKVGPAAFVAPTPVLRGTAKADNVLTFDTTTWSTGRYTLGFDSQLVKRYQWYRAGVAVPMEIGPGYRLSAADVGKKVKLRVSISKPG
ncbi:S8 family serine peptidase [Arthrobacter globiformis]|uniref:S8 family serine peptidase n=1 Tax=Arthrobacter globiformis TaxID=1665 RepID=UPI00277E1F19|nr:S8 family serine peptidase [Arthrobacter globiformis]MDQ0864835.1 subtilisin family serine protease [Arthrobacter globiformis]